MPSLPTGPRTRRTGLTSPTALTVALSALVGGAGTVLAAAAPAAPLLTKAPRGTLELCLLAAFAAAFFTCELGQALIEVRRSAYSFSLSGVPLLLGVLFLPPHHLLAVRVLASVAAFTVQRTPPLKLAYNGAAYLLDTALVLALAHALVPAPADLVPGVALRCYVALVAVDLLMSTLVLLVIRINAGPVGRADAAEVLLPASVCVTVSTALALVCAVLLLAGTLGAALLAVVVVGSGLAYRAYLILRGRHQSMQQVQDFVSRGERAQTADDLARTTLTHLQELLRASRVQLLVHPGAGGDGGPGLRVDVDEDGRTAVAPWAADDEDLFVVHHVRSAEPALLSARRGDALTRAWLADRGVREALIVPLDRSGTTGALLALGRTGDVVTFSADDLALLTTLAGHLTVALRSRRLVEQLRYEASHDVLTGLSNRALLTEQMCRQLLVSRSSSVLLLDLNNFKEVNDAFGHPVGDQLLKVVADRLRALDVGDGTVARLGGDEFAVFLPGLSAEPSARAAGHGDRAERDAATDRARQVAERITARLAEPVDLPDITVGTAASIGVAVATAGQSHDDLLRHADTAMYAAKDGGAPFVVYTPDLDRGRAERLAMLADLRRALDEDQLELHYQPKLDLTFGVVTSVEALVRWTHPVLGPLLPDVFVALAESAGLIDQLTSVVLARALRDCRAWQDAGLDVAVAVNLSARGVNDPTLPDQVAAALTAAGLPPHRLILEITESSVMGDPERTVPTLERLRDIGIALSLDDFGTGYSSLSYLQRLPVREVKIDRSFVMGLVCPEQRHASSALVGAIIGLGSHLDLRVVAEGVESADVLAELAGLGCQVVQGFHIGRPVPAHDLPRTVRAAQLATPSAVATV